jgi:hypothetical protein
MPFNPFSALTSKIFGAAALALLLAAAFLWWRLDAKSEALVEAKADLAQADARIVLLEADAALKETAAEERQADTAATVKLEKELVDAIASVPDTQPDTVRIALGCERLRRAGRLYTDLPLVCRPGTGS